MIKDLDALINELAMMKRVHGNVEVAIGTLSDDEKWMREESVEFVSFEYSGKLVLFGENISQDSKS